MTLRRLDNPPDPLKGLRGVMAGSLVIESIVLLLVLPVISRINEGAHWSTFNWVSVVVLAALMFIAAFMQRGRHGLPIIWVLQVLAFLDGLVVHYSMAIIVAIFIGLWWYIMALRRTILRRMEKGTLTSQYRIEHPDKD